MATSVADGVSLWSRFTAKAELIGAAVMRTSSDEAAAELLREATSGFAYTRSLAERYPIVASAGHVATHDPATEVVSIARFAVAETGSVALDEPRDDRGACFLAQRLWLLVPEPHILGSLDEAMPRMRDLVQQGAHHPLLMTGPSRTADIERTLTVGVHGPRALVIVVVGGA